MTFKAILLSSFVLALASPALAQQNPPPAGQPMPGQRQSPFERFDTNNDGVITMDEVRQQRTSTFTRLDTNRDGFLVRDEMAAAMAGMRQTIRTRINVTRERMGGQGGIDFGAADTNRDGAVSRSEFDAAVNAAQARRNTEAQANRERHFTALDTNRDGSLSTDEIAAAQSRRLGKRGPGMGQSGPDGGPPSPPPPRGTAGLDTNSDQKISLAEWLARPEPLFERGDANKDGRVTREEAAAIVRQGRGGEGRPNRPW